MEGPKTVDVGTCNVRMNLHLASLIETLAPQNRASTVTFRPFSVYSFYVLLYCIIPTCAVVYCPVWPVVRIYVIDVSLCRRALNRLYGSHYLLHVYIFLVKMIHQRRLTLQSLYVI